MKLEPFVSDYDPVLLLSFQVRYHHDGKFNVMNIDGPLEIYGANYLWNHFGRLPHYRFSVVKPTEPLTFTSVRESLMHVVPLCLDSDSSLIPLSCKLSNTTIGNTEVTSDLSSESPGTEDRDPDDFSFWTEKQANRICTAIKQIFDVEYAPEVVLADANLTVLANRILVSKEILSPASVNS